MERRILVNQTFKNPKKFRRTNRSMNRSTIIADNTLITSSPLQTNPLSYFLKPPALLGVNLRAGPVGSVWGLAPGRQGVQGAFWRSQGSLPSHPGPFPRLREPVEGPWEGV
jgi:hypothetical protein